MVGTSSSNAMHNLMVIPLVGRIGTTSSDGASKSTAALKSNGLPRNAQSQNNPELRRHGLLRLANAAGQTHLDTAKLAPAINAHLPDDIVVAEAEDMPQAFDANHDAVLKLYRYVIHDGPVQSPFMRRYACHHKRRLDDRAMARAAEPLK